MDAGALGIDTIIDAIVRLLPVPMVLYGNGAAAAGNGCGDGDGNADGNADTRTIVVNDRFEEIFLPGQLDQPALLEIAGHPGTGWHRVPLVRRDAAPRAACARALATPFGILVIVDDAAGRLPEDERVRLQRRIVELEKLSATDRLTGAWNRAQLDHAVAVEINRAQRQNQPVTLIMLDVDRFKRINDVHGHQVGDAVLKELVARICERMRGTDTLFRWGGEEFVVLAPAIGCRGGAVLAEELRATIAERPFDVVGTVTVSLGVAEYVEAEDAEGWFRRADRALYTAKHSGRDCVRVDRRGGADRDLDRTETGVVRLIWDEGQWHRRGSRRSSRA